MPGKCSLKEFWVSHKARIIWDEGNNKKAKCSFCQWSFNIFNMGDAQLLMHMKGNKDIKETKRKKSSIKNNRCQLQMILYQWIQQLKYWKNLWQRLTLPILYKVYMLKSEILWPLNIVQHHNSYHFNEGVTEMFQAMFTNSNNVCVFFIQQSHNGLFAESTKRNWNPYFSVINL